MTWYSPGRHAGAGLPAQVRCARQDRRAHRRAGVAAHARRAQEEAAAHPDAAGPVGRQRPGPRPHAGVRASSSTMASWSSGSAPRPSASATCLHGRCHRCCAASRRPVNLTIDLADADLQFLMANDSDLYNRWQAAQDYATRVLVEAVKAIRAGKRPAQALGLRGRARRDTGRCKPRARLSRPVHVPAERERPGPRHRPGCGPARHPQGAQGVAQGDRRDPLPGPCRCISRQRAQRALLAGAGASRQAGAAQCGARLSGQPRPPRGHRPGRGPFRQCQQCDR